METTSYQFNEDYSHTLQYFPVSSNTIQHEEEVFSYNFPSVASIKTKTTHHINEYDDNKLKKTGQQKRSWNTDNFQWMNIKRTRKSSSDGRLILV